MKFRQPDLPSNRIFRLPELFFWMINMLNWQTKFPLQNNHLQKIATVQSLTAALSQLGEFSVRVDFLGETQSPHDFTDFRLPENLFSRKVTLFLDNIPVVYAQSFCETSSSWRDILNCGTTPLGEILFSGSLNIQRSAIEFSLPEHALLARRSWFAWNGEYLYLAEYFSENVLPFCRLAK